jgi:subtilase family serine protease
VLYDTTDKAGERTIRLVVDPMSTITESDEGDNEAITVLTVAPPPSPNLVVATNNIRFSPASPSDGQVVTITVTVLNDGQRNAGRVEVQVMDATNGTPVPVGAIQVIGGIASGDSGTIQVAYDTTGKEGERTIQVTVDPANLIAENNEEDNEASATLTIGPPADDPSIVPNLVMASSSVTFTPTQPAPGTIVSMTIIVRNDGAVDANAVVVRVMDVTETPTQVGDDVIIPTIAAGQSMTATMLYDTTDKEGSQSLTVSADPDNTITESNENDNTATVMIPVGGEPGEPGEPPTGEPPTSEPSLIEPLPVGTPTPQPVVPVEPDEPDPPTEVDGDEGESAIDANAARPEEASIILEPVLSVDLAEDLNLRN